MLKTNSSTVHKNKHRQLTLRLLLIGIVVVTAGVVGMLTLQKTRLLDHHIQPATNTHTGSQSTKGEVPGAASDSSPDSSTPSQSDPSTTNQPGQAKDDGATQSSGKAPVAPSGGFVSNYTPNLSGSPKPNNITSVCTTTPSASCQIFFTKGGVIKSLDATTADSGGSVYWNWNLKDLGLSVGSWTIKATATLNGKTVSTTDELTLDIQP